MNQRRRDLLKYGAHLQTCERSQIGIYSGGVWRYPRTSSDPPARCTCGFSAAVRRAAQPRKCRPPK